MADRTPRLVLSEISALVDECRGLKIAMEDAADTALQARKINGRVWGIVNTAEANLTEELYDILGMLNAAFVKSGKDPAQFVVELVMAGALVVRAKPLISEMRRYGLNALEFSTLEDYADTPEA
ncbi:MAG: hypothetical protein EP299_01765 [Acidobacteria bacterium]|nr:MAG: hypothetical protein EP299_01765 [Acidobacteriota bacterium]